MRDQLIVGVRRDGGGPLAAAADRRQPRVGRDDALEPLGRAGAETRGVVAPDMTIEDVQARMGEILAETDGAQPRTTGEALAWFMEVLGYAADGPIGSVAGASERT